MSGAVAQRPFRTAGFQRVPDPLAPFFRPFLGRAKKGQYIQRAAMLDFASEMPSFVRPLNTGVVQAQTQNLWRAHPATQLNKKLASPLLSPPKSLDNKEKMC